MIVRPILACLVAAPALLLANAAWCAGRAISRARQLALGTASPVREHELEDIWINVLHPFASSSYVRPAAGARAAAIEPPQARRARAG